MSSQANSTYWNRISRFLKRQVKQIKEGGLPVFWRKIVKMLKLLLALPVVLFIRLLRPFIIIRFRRLVSSRIGHFTANIEVYLCERDAGINLPSVPYIDIWYLYPFVCNIQLKKMWKRILHIWPALLVQPVDQLSSLLPGREAHMIPCRVNQDRDIHNVLERIPPHLTFQPQEEEQGQAGLRALGVPEGKSFVCFHNRDSAYLDAVFPGGDWRYHSYRDSNIHNYVMAAEILAQRGYYNIRMGAVVKEALRVSNPRIIDYATNGHRNDFMDVYLGAKCTFFISSSGGIAAVPEIFRRPYMVVDFAPLEHAITWNARHLFIPKKHWLRVERRFMTFREILDSGAGRFLFTQQFEERGIELIENTPEEIATLAIEMDERLKGIWETNEEDEELQRRFWMLFKPSELNSVFRARIGAEFLSQHRDWLE